MSISMIADNGYTPVRIIYISPKRIIKGLRLEIGWFFIRIGAKILYGKEWEAY